MPDPSLLENIDSQATSDFESGRTNHLADLTCSIGAVVTSFIATILAGAGVPSWIAASAAALPGTFITLQRTIDFRGRAAWYFLKASKLRGISLSLQHEGLAADSASKQFRDTETEMEQQWSKFVRSSHALLAKP